MISLITKVGAEAAVVDKVPDAVVLKIIALTILEDIRRFLVRSTTPVYSRLKI